LLYQWCALIHARKPIQLAEDQCFRPIAAADLGRIVVELIDSQARGLFHVAGPEQVTSPELFRLLYNSLNEYGVQFSVQRELCRIKDLPGLELRPAYTLLAIERLKRQINPRFAPLETTVRTVAERAFALSPIRRQAAASVD
jgi:dTDP-4-dehydrorhamnose reductase